MGNPHKGEVSFKAGEDSHTLSFSADALAELESVLKKNVNEIGAAMQNPATFSIDMVRTMFWAGLLDSHDGEIDMKSARAIFRKIGITEAISLIGEAFTKAFPDQPKAEAGAPAVDPLKPAEAAAGTGQASSLNGSLAA